LTALPHFGRSGFLHDFEFPFEAPTEHWQFWQQPSIEQLALTYLDRQPTDIGRVAEEHYQFVYLALSLRIFRTQNKKPSLFLVLRNIPSKMAIQIHDQITRYYLL